MRTFASFMNLYSLQKTLRFELIPIGRTKESFRQWLEEIETYYDLEKEADEIHCSHDLNKDNLKAMKKVNILFQDILREKNYEKIKKLLDEYHKDFIEHALANVSLNNLERYEELYFKANKDNKERAEFDRIKMSLRKQIAESFSKSNDKNVDDRWKNLFGKKLFKSILKNWVAEKKEYLLQKFNEDFSNENELYEVINEFSNFTTYFKGFNENRKNLYSEDNKFSTIAHRLIHENLPKFIDNIYIFKKVVSSEINTEEIEKELELLDNLKLTDVFSLNFFSKTLTQQGIDFYNYVLGGRSENNSKKIRGVNEIINLYNQQQHEKNKRIPLLKPLYKLPLFERTTSSYKNEPICDDRDLIERLRAFYYSDLKQHRDNASNSTKDILEELKMLLANIDSYREGLYINGGTTLTQISQKIFGSWSYIKDALSEYYEKHISPTSLDNKEKRKKSTTAEKEKEKWLKQKQFPIVLVEEALINYAQQEANEELKTKITETTICDFFKRLGANENGINIFDQIDRRLNEKNEHGESLYDILNTSFNTDKKLMQDKARTLLIKNFLDVLQGDKDDITAGLLHFVKALKPREEIGNKNESFYSILEQYYSVLNEVTSLYNKARNYLTQKPFSVEKVKLNFENSTLLDGWDENKEADNSCVLLRKNGFYYLGVLHKNHRNIFKQYQTAQSGEDAYEKMIYKLLPGPNKMLPKVFFADSNISFFNPSEEILRIRNTASHSKNGKPQKGFSKAPFSIDDCRKYIDFCKQSIAMHEDWKNFNFQFRPTDQYNDSSDFYKEIEHQGYKINFTTIPESYINQLVEEGKLYLFKIYNKDFSANKINKGKDNLHTLYWKMLFDEQNLKNVVVKLNGEAEVFFRPKSLSYSEEIWQKGHHYDELSDKFKYPIIKNRRYAQDKFFFHVPITLNFKAIDENYINHRVNEWLINNPNVHIIGIDRGERHLLYVSVINQNGEIVEQCSLNEIVTEYNGKLFVKDYHSLLDKREGEREKARKDWQTIENIKELKSGYLSHVIHKIAQLILKYNAIVVMEDLNTGFKRGRQKVEKQVYQNFEKMLIEKLNYLVLKDKKPEEDGGVLRAFQLTNKFSTFKELGKQSGIVFYVPAAYTSAIDPVTGYVQYLYPLKQADSVEKARAFYSKFRSIHYNPDKHWFEFVFDYNDFDIRFDGKTFWKICTTHTDRYAWNSKLNNGKGGFEEVKVAQELELLLGDYNIPYGSGNNIIEEIVNIKDVSNEKTAKRFFSSLNHLLNTTLKLRHNNGKKGSEEQDYILSPVAPFFDSR
ncbi:MAG: type V CRISPR-associated protein Cas12a/Cpf1, partial [Bacteroidales bacterium]|nr:type V CRISPR-associated protein Cas12a/Cpf1 [Bacteroidales bacterium]